MQVHALGVQRTPKACFCNRLPLCFKLLDGAPGHAADILREQKRQNEAAPLYTEALEIYRKHKDTPPLDLANAIRGFALLKEDVGDRTEALSLWREARDLYELTGIPAGVSESDRRIGVLVAD